MTLALDPSWRPPEDDLTILNEQTWLAGMILAAVAYGIVFTLFFLSIGQLIKTTTKHNRVQRLSLIIYNTVMFILGTLFVGGIAKMAQLSFIDYRLFPGGPAAFKREMFTLPIDQMAIYSFVIANWLADGIMIFRYMVIYRSCTRFPYWAIITLPILGYMASFSLGVAWLIRLSSPASPTSSGRTSSGSIRFTAIYFWTTLSFNISMTIAICARLLILRWSLRILGNRIKYYTSLAAIIVESSFLYTAFSFLYLIPYALNSPIQNAFIQPLGEVQIIAPLLITYRVASGVDETSSSQVIGDLDLSAIQFQTSSNLTRATDFSQDRRQVP